MFQTQSNIVNLCYLATKTLNIYPKYGTYFRLSLWVLYSSTVFGGKFRTLRNVSRILAVVDESDAVLFHTDIISSYKH
jgi:hypothetical protein